MLSYDKVTSNQIIRTYIIRADESLASLGFTEHSFAHAVRVADTAGYILSEMGFDAHTIEHDEVIE